MPFKKRLPPGGSCREATEGERVTVKIALAFRYAGSFRHAYACHLPLGGRLIETAHAIIKIEC